MKKTFTPQQKANVALAAIKGSQTVNQISSAYKVHPTQVQAWKKQALSGISEIFSDKRKKENNGQEKIIEDLYKIVGQRDIELEWLKKKLQPFST